MGEEIMFGYVRYDMPNLYIKDFMLYKALYCGLCKGIGKSCGQRARMGLTYDVAFLSALLHNIAGQDIKIEMQNCFEHAIRKRPIAQVDALTEELGALNTLLAYYKLTDDVQDRGKGRGKRVWFKSGFRRAKKKYPKLVQIVEKYMKEQSVVEKEHASTDRAADPTASMMRSLSVHLLGEKATEATGELFYFLGKWVYLIDALDDVDKDVQKRTFNPFVEEYGCKSRQELIEKYGDGVGFSFDTIFYSLRENLSQVTFHFNRDLTDNVILRGIPMETMRVMKGEKQRAKPLKF